MKETTLNKNKPLKKFVFQQYGMPSLETWERFRCGQDYHCIQGEAPRNGRFLGDWPKTKKTLCNRPAVNFHTDPCFSIEIKIENAKPKVVGGGIPFEEIDYRGGQVGLIKKLCPKCLSKIKRLEVK
jgi:hypothetical protein